ncbi:hypothetical protein ASPZODRAFT_135985 [Penicilliopsis zonata CBS 506.65]|uniref:Carboxylic ester hydrolase n=1 Tax=Penicilliopsis zonata CBS 506.65 TaxID=1073090 RepID=A0A1L9S8P5_9EURO|nr:hypothetical protein ASPZODRAFT_135985 [Penicilliopsis zonata CBS 506.65]OJJ43528.1 hypothetical protein ASPZODRAFT_135985 [Penicilliopsis zonata CBS 506.65]
MPATTSGLVKGTSHNGITAYLGIPYAASPAGPNRWRPPRPAEKWTGVRECVSYGPVAPQIAFEDMQFETMDEDCLNLNVWTSDPQTALPVFVWFYGGRFVAGAGSQRIYDGASLASKGVVVVTLNYRVGILGFLAHPELDREGLAACGVECSGNYGLLDQRAALEWIRDNIAAFGGDPHRVTIAGQSAGAASVGLHLLSPLSKGLFHGAISQSGQRFTHDPMLLSLAPAYRSKETALRQGVETVAEKGCATLAEMRALPVDILLQGNNKNEEIETLGPPNPPPPPFYRPCVDGHFLPAEPGECLRRGTQSDVPVLTGHNADEGGTIGVRKSVVMTDEQIRHAARRRYTSDEMTDRFFQLYPLSGGAVPATSFDADPRYAAWNAQARNNSRVTVAMWAEQFHQHAASPVYGYFFDKIPPQKAGGNEKFGAHHAAELPYVFDNFVFSPEYPWSEGDKQVAQTVSTYWVNFIQHGDPNGFLSGEKEKPQSLPYFPPVGKEIMRLGEKNGAMKLTETSAREVFCREFLLASREY